MTPKKDKLLLFLSAIPILLDRKGYLNSTKIYYIREQKVMLDKDLAELYGVQAIRLREQVKRNIERFPENFMFQLTPKEVDAWYRKMRYHQKSI